ncbi:PAC2 family protein [Corynebacterium meitnerae]|uniref:PAC2 family protein n=1 Tax=Corynebacterium meitnerae TaxID=2913498 RepID=A0A9X3LUM5_9CORY|nr:PAC2 family protein [Corynebacterium meitnerae]MCZ9294495.1 PAC2 family protein [Corynebacterium meitnerae]
MTSDDKRQMYELEYPAPAVDGGASSGPTLIIAMQGYADAGHAVEGAAGHLKAALDSRTVATFNNDELIDYRSRRPMVTMSEHEITDMESIELDMRVLRDSKGSSFLLLSGPEPDLRWEAFSKSVADLADHFNVDKVISLYSAPMGAPHTRPLVVSAHGNDRELVGPMFTYDGMVSMPGAAAVMIERELHARGHRVAGYTAHVPHYVSASPYPQAVFQLLQSISDTSKLQFPLRSIEQDVARVELQLAQQTRDSEEIAQVVHQLEQHYDREMESYRKKNPQKMMPGEAQVPSGEEIGEAFENFLAAIDDRDRGRGLGPAAEDLMWEHDPQAELDTYGDHAEPDDSADGDSPSGNDNDKD